MKTKTLRSSLVFRIIPFIALTLFLCGCDRDGGTTTPPPGPVVKNLEIISTLSISVSEPSGLAYNHLDTTLYTVSDGNPILYKLDFNGKILSTVAVNASDLEGIVLSSNCDTIYVVQEAKQLVTAFKPDGTLLYSFPVKVAISISSSLEGITIDNSGNLVVLNEKDPMMVLKFKNSIEIWRKTLNYSLDISDICYDNSLNCFWIVSDESKTVLKLSEDCELISRYSISLPKGEGISVIGDRIYIVSDSESKMYVFKKPAN
ncbi:MAG: SdiA-regulated domain-containing protein [Ignavibacteriaceae bacterium]